MVSNRFKHLYVCLIIIMGVILVGCNSETSGNSNDEEPSRLTMGSSSSGSTYYVIGAALSQILESETGITINMESGGGSTTNIQLIDQGEMDIGMTVTSMASEGWEGEGWAEGTKYQNVRTMFPILTNYLHIYALEESGIASINDLNGLNVATGTVGTSSEATGNQLIELFGIDANQVIPLPTDQGVDGLKDGTVDVGFSTVGLPGPFMQDLETTHNPILISLTQEEMDRILEEYAYYSDGTIPAGTYENQSEDVKAVSYANFLIAHKDFSEDVVYELTRVAFENKEELIEIHPSLEALTLEGILESTIPIHPGAVKYYEEQGITIPDELK